MGTESDTLGDADWLRGLTLPEEDRWRYTSAPWRGEVRRFRSPNVVCLEEWKRQHSNNK
jgi:hypothetical protein